MMPWAISLGLRAGMLLSVVCVTSAEDGKWAVSNHVSKGVEHAGNRGVGACSHDAGHAFQIKSCWASQLEDT